MLDSVWNVSQYLIYFACSSTQLIVNKHVAIVLGAPAVLLTCQCTFAAVFLKYSHLFGDGAAIRPLHEVEVESFVVIVFFFVLIIFSSLKGLQTANVDTVICLRMTSPLLLSLIDYFFLGRLLPSKSSFAAMLGIACTFSYFTFTESAWEMRAIIWLSLWYFSMIFESAYVKYVVNQSRLTVTEQAFYQNFLAVPFLMIVAVITGELFPGNKIAVLKKIDMCFLLLSCVLGLGLSHLGFAIRRQISATSFSILGNICKLLTILINLVVWDKHSSSAGTVVIVLCVLSSALYRQAPLRNPSEPSDESGQNVAVPYAGTKLPQRAATVCAVLLLLTCFLVERQG